MWGISWLTANQLAAQEGLCTMEWVSKLYSVPKTSKYAGVHKPRATKFCAEEPEVCGSSVWSMLHVIVLACGVLWRFSEFWRICTPMQIKSSCNNNLSVNKTIFYRRHTTCFWSLSPSSGIYIYIYIYIKVRYSLYRPGVAQRVGRGVALLFHDCGPRRGWMVSSTPRPHFTPGKNRYPFYRRLGGLQGRSGRAENLFPTGIRSRTVQPVVSHYTDWATGPTHQVYTDLKFELMVDLGIQKI